MKEDNTIPKSFKMTELGPLPETWEVVRLGETIEEAKEKNRLNVKYPVFTVSNLYGFILSDKFFDKQVYSKQLNTYKIVRNYFFAYNPYRINVGSIGLFKSEIGLVSPAYVVFKTKSADYLYPWFLYGLLKSSFYISEIKRIAMSRGSVRRSLSFKDLSNFKVPLPPLPEQKRIAAAFSTVQEAKEKAGAVIEVARELRKSLMKYLFTYGPVPMEKAENVLLKETEIGLVPEEWEVKTIKESVRSIDYGYSISIPKNEDKYGVPIISTADITKDGRILYNQIRKIVSPKRLPERLILKDGDILFNWRNSPELIGKTAIFKRNQNNETYIYASFILRIRCDEINSHNIYIKYLLNYYREIGVFLKLARRAVNQANYNKNEINALKIPFPSLLIQQKIAEMLSQVDRKIEAEENEKKALEELFKTLLNNLMTAKIRVNHLEIAV